MGIEKEYKAYSTYKQLDNKVTNKQYKNQKKKTELLAMPVNSLSPRSPGRVASFAQFREMKNSLRTMKQRRASMCLADEMLNGWGEILKTRRNSFRNRSGADFKKFKTYLKKRRSACPSTAAVPEEHARKKPKTKRPGVNCSGPALTRFNLSKLTNRKGEDIDNAKQADQFILVESILERNLDGILAESSYSKMTYVINNTVVLAFYVGGDSMQTFRKHGVTRRWSAEAIGPRVSDDNCGYTLKTMPKLKPIYCASKTVQGYEMTFPNMPQFLALFEKDSRRIFDWQNLQDFGGKPILVQESFESVRQRLEQRAADGVCAKQAQPPSSFCTFLG